MILRSPENEGGTPEAAAADAAANAATEAAAAEAAKATEAKAGEGDGKPSKQDDARALQDRMGELTRKRRDAERRAEAAEARATKAEAERQAAEALLAAKPQLDAEGKPIPDARPRTAAKTVIDFDDPEVQRAIEERARVQLTAQEIQRKGDVLYDHGEKEFGKAKFDKALEGFKPFDGLRADVARAIFSVPEGHRVLNHLGNSAAEIDRIYKLAEDDPIAMAVEITKLSNKLASAPAKKVSDAPEPPEELRGRNNNSASTHWDDPNASMDEFVKGREKHLKDKGLRL